MAVKALLLLICSFLYRCSQPKVLQDTLITTQSYTLPYDMTTPSDVWALNGALEEISGITYDADSSQVVAINDEEGILFRLSDKSGAIVSQKKFGKKGDYESISMDSQKFYVVKSNGHVYIIDRESNQVTTLQTDFSAKHDIEASEINQDGHLLLLAKGKQRKESAYRWIYLYDFSKASISQLYPIKVDKEIYPSALAIHPLHNHHYILCAKNKLLIIVNPTSQEVIAEVNLPSIHLQAEGICFDPFGNMYLSDEGGKGMGKITRYDMTDE